MLFRQQIYTAGFLLTCISHSLSLSAQTNFKWANSLGESSTDQGHAVITDASGNVYVAGTFQSANVDFDPGVGTYTLSSRGSNDVFLAKYNSLGGFIWAVDIGGTGSDQLYSLAGNNIAVDPSGNVYISGRYASATIYFDAALTFSVTTQGGEDGFFAKYDANGNCLWAKGVGGGGTDYCGGIAVDASGNVGLTGFFDSNPVDCEPGTGNFILANASGASFDGFLAKYDAGGNCLWAYALAGAAPSGGRAGSPNMYGRCAAFDASGNLYFTGSYAARCIFGATNLDVIHDFDIYLVKYNPAGTIQWAKSVGGIGFDFPKWLHIDASNNIYLSGRLVIGGDVDPGAGTAYLNDPANTAKVVTVTLSGTSGTASLTVAGFVGGGEMPAKTITFNTNLSTTASDFVASWAADYAAGGITVTSSGADLIFTSPFKGWDFFTGTTTNSTGDLAGTHVVTTASVYNSASIFFGKYDVNGNYVWAHCLQNGGNSATSISANSSGAVFLSGILSTTEDFDPGAGVASLSTSGGNDIFMARYTSSGTYIGAVAMGAAGDDRGNAITVDNSNNIYLAGTYQNTVDFDCEIGVANLTSLGGTDAFLAKYGSALLPVELLSFSGYHSEHFNFLEWATGSEINNDHFIVERSLSPNEMKWEPIGRVNGAGNSSSVSRYSFADEQTGIVRSSGQTTFFYRLKQVDYNGKFIYYGPVAVNRFHNEQSGIHAIASDDHLLVLFPEKFTGKDCQLKIYDMNGKISYSSLFLPTESQNDILINTTGWSKGVYMIAAYWGDETPGLVKFIKP